MLFFLVFGEENEFLSIRSFWMQNRFKPLARAFKGNKIASLL